ncbi:hypothetical protein BN8_00778 [Fibrisoma limi BUZ 3]|uniref:Uncharacterized protein n=1 Tax=Fibrisoma limi BUZ 3 TaxID=1185876 RepID=I2GD53_9BACT|nr:hypothetical protein [Fibrisoma limi]CCH51827.1 hypothetical protein BN8_00778 [Fibrisoma limi BUZ 3]
MQKPEPYSHAMNPFLLPASILRREDRYFTLAGCPHKPMNVRLFHRYFAS